MWTLIGGWISSFFSGWTLYLFLAAVVVGGTATVYFTITHNAAQEQLLKDQKAEDAQLIKDKQMQIDQLNGIIIQNNTDIQALNTQLDSIRTQFQSIQDSLNDPAVIAQDHPSSQILKDIIKQLGGQ